MHCHWCGREMIVVKQSTSGISGGGGARYRCPNTPHPRCPKCKRTMERNFYWNGSTITYRDDKWHCRKCEQAKAQATEEDEEWDQSWRFRDSRGRSVFKRE